MPYKDLAKRRAMLRRLASERRNRGLCSRCNSQRLPDDSRCSRCRDAQRAAERMVDKVDNGYAREEMV